MTASRAVTFAAILGFAFLYVPIIVLVAYSFNDSRIATVWGGFSLRWYEELIRGRQILEAALTSLRIAATAASIATVFGTLAAFALVRYGRFRLRTALSGMLAAPLVMPEVITGLSLLLLFVTMETALGWPGERGFLTIVLAHSTFCMAFVAVVVESRLVASDLSIEEAATDLGASPMRVFFDVTLPTIAPALVSAWLLAFTLSLDDLVIASFVSGPGASTLPMVIFSKVRLGVSPEINALAAIMLAVVGSGVAIAALLLTRRTRK